MIQRFDKPTCRLFTKEIEDALTAIAKKHGLALKAGGGRYDDLHYWPKVEFSVTTTVDGLSAEKAEFDRWCDAYGCRPEDYGKTFRNGRDEFKLVGFEIGRSKFSVRGERLADGKRLLFTRDVLHQIRKEVA